MKNGLFEESVIVRMMPIGVGLFHVFHASKKSVDLWDGIDKVPPYVCGGEIKVLDAKDEKLKDFIEEATRIRLEKDVCLYEYWSN